MADNLLYSYTKIIIRRVFYKDLEFTAVSILRLSFVTHETLIKPYISRSSKILFKSASFKDIASLLNAFTKSESVMLPACFTFS